MTDQEPDEVKDFAYYAEAAENALDNVWKYSANFFDKRMLDAAICIANTYARLAAAAPVTLTTEEADNPGNFFWYLNGVRMEGERCTARLHALKHGTSIPDLTKQCIHKMNHDAGGAMHETEDGIHFDD